MFRVEQDGGLPGAVSDYAFNKGNLAYLSRTHETTGLFDINSSIRFRDVQDGTANTFMIGEAASNPMLEAEST